MIYPIDVNSNLVNARKLVGRDRTAVILQLFFFGNVILFFLLRFLVGKLLQLDMIVAWIAQIVICVFVGVLVFRVFIFKEDEKIREYENSESDSFSKYLNIRKDSEYCTKVGNNYINLYEYTNGCSACTMCFKFGSNDNTKAQGAKLVLQNIFKIAFDYNFECRTIILPEKFAGSKEFKKYIESVNSVEDTKLGLALRELAEESLNYSNANSCVDALYIIFKTDAPYKRADLENFVCTVFKVLGESIHCFRSVTTLSMNECMEFFREFSTVEAIDLSMTKALDMISALDTVSAKSVGIYAFESIEGKKLRNDKLLEEKFYLSERRIQ